tara:strand:- start:15215 stop:15472 length:258 start_codon:yes stop_codon:yes gene_type:complete
MGKLEASSTWLLTISILGYLATTNYYTINSNCKNENNLNWNQETENQNKATTNLNYNNTKINIDSLLTVVLEEIEVNNTTHPLLD